jgi:hypothetical protein
MNQSHPARVRWYTVEEDGRKAPPSSGGRFCTVARFPDDPTWPDEAWSVVVYFKEPVADDGSVMAHVAFLIPEEAPNERLRPGARFELLDGPRPIADVEVLQ